MWGGVTPGQRCGSESGGGGGLRIGLRIESESGGIETDTLGVNVSVSIKKLVVRGCKQVRGPVFFSLYFFCSSRG